MFASRRLTFSETKSQVGWYKTFECLWSSTTEIRGKVTLNDHYEDLKEFFVGTLGVKMLTLQMVFDELTQPNPRKTTDEVKSTIWSFNELLQTEPTSLDPTRLLKACVFPIRYPNGTVTLSSATTEFAIADREYLDLRFRGLIKLLDYGMEDVRHLKPFFEWANLTRRYLSFAVRETTFVERGNTRPVTTPNRDLKRKAYALLR